MVARRSAALRAQVSFVEKKDTDQIVVEGGHRLNGVIDISGAKNSALILMCASLLAEETVRLTNVPSSLRDIRTLTKVLEQMGAIVATGPQREMAINAGKVDKLYADYELVNQMRASFLVLGPLLTRFNNAVVSLPGGCAIGERPVDFHLNALKAMGADIQTVGTNGYVHASAEGGLRGADITFPKVSVGATENTMMAATLAKGITRIFNAACEPEIVDLGNFLNAMGAKVEGHGTPEITITGVEKLHGATHEVIPDRIEAGTYMVAVAMTGGKVLLRNINADLMREPIDVLRKAGVDIQETDGGLLVTRDRRKKLKGVDIRTAPYPGFPTDLQAQHMVMLTQAKGGGTISEDIWENRYLHVGDLRRLGASIDVNGTVAKVEGPVKLSGARIMATDLRAAGAFVLAGLAAEGTTTIDRIYHLDRGYENMTEKLQACGAKITRVPKVC